MTPGTLIGGKYRLRRPLGDGAMGVVWAAVNELTEKEVALKLLQSQNPELRRRLLREAKACGRLSHRNIVEIYDVGETKEGDPFLVMELLKGEVLAERLLRERSLSPTDAVGIAVDVARALRVAHEAGVIHRDLKPANIFLHRSDDDSVDDVVAVSVKVLDFGVSKLAIENEATATVTGSLLGSPAYMSPEQARGTSIDGRADLWALGIVLFEMLTGVRPFQNRSATGVIAEILTSPIPRVDSLAPKVSPMLADIIARCIERDVERRVKNADELIRLLRPFTVGRGQLQSTWDGAPTSHPVPPPAPSTPQFNAPPLAPATIWEPHEHPSEEGAPTEVYARQVIALNAVAPAPLPRIPSAPMLPGPPPPRMSEDTEEDVGAPTELYRRDEISAPAMESAPPRSFPESQRPTLELPPRPSPWRGGPPPIPEAPRLPQQPPGAATALLPDLMRGGTMPLGAAGGVPMTAAKTVGWSPLAGVPTNDASTSSMTPVSHGARLPSKENTATRAKGTSKNRLAILLIVGALLSVAIGAIVVITVIRGDQASGATVDNATPATTTAPLPLPSSAILQPSIVVAAGAAPPPEPTPSEPPLEDTTSPTSRPFHAAPAPPSATTSAPEPEPVGTAILNINSVPIAKVLIDGKPLGSTPKIGVSVKAGTHNVTFIAPYEEKRTVTVRVKSGETKVVSFKFPYKFP